MGVIKRTCPHCRTQAVAFTARHDWSSIDGKRTLFTCGSCAEGVIWTHGGSPGGGTLAQISGDHDRTPIIFGQQWPEQPTGAAPDDTPPNVARYFEQATSSLEVGNFDAAGMMFRKSLETATKILNSDHENKKLVRRIDALKKDGLLTSDLADWAHEVRLGGNEAAHEDEPFTAEQSEALRNFTENFLLYTFTLPSAVKRRAKGSEVAYE